jgi:uncharacterized protein (TIGR03118 family)
MLWLVFVLPLTAGTIYMQQNLVSDIPGLAATTDPNLVNPWGISRGSTTPIWVSNEGTDTSTIYTGDGVPQPLVVSIPPPSGAMEAGPTGQVFNGGTSFELSPGQPARFLFATESGTIAGWNPATAPTNAVTMVDNSASGAAYLGLASGNNGSGDLLYAANFAQGRIDVFDSGFSAVTLSGSFTDPNLPSGYSPFNIQNVGGMLYVMYAVKDPEEPEEVPGAGLGIVNVFDTNGNFVRRLASHGPLNAPWAIVQAPAGFGDFSGALLVGNFGDGAIHAFDSASGNLLGTLEDRPGHALENEGLWGLVFGNGGRGGNPNSLFFAAGINDEHDGLFGRIDAVPEPGTWTLAGIGALLLSAGVRRRRRC